MMTLLLPRDQREVWVDVGIVTRNKKKQSVSYDYDAG